MEANHITFALKVTDRRYVELCGDVWMENTKIKKCSG